MPISEPVNRFAVLVDLLLMSIIVAAFWFDTDLTRTNYLLIIPVVLVLRLVLRRRLWTPTPLDLPLLLFVVWCAINIQPGVAPYSRGWFIMGRLLMGAAFALSLAEYARTLGSTRALLWLTILIGGGMGALALVASQWTNKSAIFFPIIQQLPAWRGFPGGASFNVNEVGGALTWVLAVVAGLLIYDVQTRRGLRLWVGAAAFVLLAAALMFGQSRFAIFGVLGALGLLVLLIVPRGRWQVIGLGIIALVGVFEVALVLGFGSQSVELNTRDESSLAGRIDIYESALAIVRDYPLTGVGLNNFRIPQVRAIYPAPAYNLSVLPHTHNELLQVATDAGVPGLALYLAMYGAIVYMLVQTWRRGDFEAKAVAASVGAGLLAHNFFALGDAITLWDRFIWVHWLLIGLAAGQYAVTRERAAAAQPVVAEAPARTTYEAQPQ